MNEASIPTAPVGNTPYDAGPPAVEVPAGVAPAERSPVAVAPEIAEAVTRLTADAVIAVDTAGTIVFFSPAAESLFGRSAADVLGRPLAEVCRSAAAGPVAGVWPAGGEIREIRADGTTVVAEVRSTRIAAGPAPWTVYLLRDRTADRRAEQELRLLRTLTLAIGEAADLHSALRLAMQMIGSVTGWTAGESWLPDASGKRLRRGPIWSGRDGLERFHTASETLSFGPGFGLPGRVWRSRRPEWVEDVTADAAFRRVDVARASDLRTGVAIPVLAGQHVVAVIAFFHTEVRDRDPELVSLISTVAAQLGTLIQRRQIEEELQRHAADLAHSNAELEQFAYVASHDLQEPLRMVASFTQLLARRYADRLDADAHEFIGYAVEGVTRMQQLINDLLTLSRVGTRTEPLVPTAVDDVLDRVLLEIEPLTTACSAVVTRDPLPVVAADPVQLAQVFDNLVANALKFRGAQAPQVHVSARRGHHEWILSVADNGIGIAPEYFPRIWAIFQRLHSRAEYPGTGIGLSICKKIVERHGGRIWVESESGRGSTFHFSLPDGNGTESDTITAVTAGPIG